MPAVPNPVNIWQKKTGEHIQARNLSTGCRSCWRRSAASSRHYGCSGTVT